MFVETAIFVCIAGILLWFLSKRPTGYPPGPPRLPVIGNLHQMMDRKPSHIVFTEMREKYGDIFSIDFGWRRAIVLNDFKSIKDALTEDEFSGRPRMKPIIERSGGVPRGIIHVDGAKWSEQRRFVLKNLREFGFGKQSMEGMVLDEIKELIDTFRKEIGKPITTQNKFNAAVVNALWSIIAGDRFPHGDPRLKDLIGKLTSNFKESKNTGFTTAFDWLVTFAPRISGWEKILANFEVIMNSMKEVIDRHKDTFQEGSARDFIDVCLAEMLKTTDPQSAFFGLEAETNLKVVIFDLFAAGAETTSTTLTWTFLLLALHPECQEKLYEEITRVVGNSRLPSLSDRPNMPYAEAVIMEAQRFASIAPLSVFHRVLEPVNLHGFLIPKNTIVIPNLYSAMRDYGIWTNPEIFEPERFLSKDGQSLIQHEAFIPFGIGKRVCIGQTLAKVELFLFTTSLFQAFQVQPDPNTEPPKIEYFTGTVLILKPHKLHLTERK